MPGFVLDASIALAAILPGESGATIAAAVISRIPAEPAHVPQIWRIEVGNVIVTAVRRHRLARELIPMLLDRLHALPVNIDTETSNRAWDRTIGLALARGLTLYDAVYLELALRLGVPLAGFDIALRLAARAENVPLATEPA